ncbi:MAG: PIN domain-containing protein [Proteobacteria bacterium]|nr:PIN domain-containing protein [Pseudomonadota bacterium]
MLTYLFDTSAWIAHVFKEPGWEYLNALFDEDGSSIGISVVSLTELHGRLKALGYDEQFESLCEFYRPLFDQIVSVDENIALRAIALKRVATDRLPGFDALIAATASLQEAVLIHRDAHFHSISSGWLKQETLPTLD